MVTSSDGNSNFMYYLNDGIYGTFNFLAFNDHYSVTPLVLKVVSINLGTACMVP